MRLLPFVLLLHVLGAAVAPAFGAPQILLGVGATPIEHYAALELQRCIYSVTGKAPAVESVQAVPVRQAAIVLGTEASLPEMDATWPFGLEVPRHDGYIVRTVRRSPPLIVIAAPTPQGVQNGVFGWLESLGFGFYLSGDIFPSEVPGLEDLDLPEYRESHTPAFATRGAMPQNDYPVGTAMWDLADYKAYIDQLVRMRCNYVLFEAGDPTPAAAQPVMPPAEFFAGTGRYFPESASGSDNAKTLQSAICYAKARGVRVGLRIDVDGDPFAPATQAQFEEGLVSVLGSNPEIDTLWLWQPRSQARYPGGAPGNRGLCAAYTRHWAQPLALLSTAEERAEAARLCLFAAAARQIADAHYPAGTSIAMGGWGGEDPFMFTTLLPAMDRILPADVVFAAMDDAPVAPAVSVAYGALAPARERWPVLYWECAGDLWMPQPNLAQTAQACRDALAKGCQGLLGAHWRTREPEESAAFCARFAWDPALTVEAFLRRRAVELAGPEHAEFVAARLTELQDLGYRWAGGSGQNMDAPFVWSAGDYAKRTRLARIGYDLRTLGQASSGRLAGLGKDVAGSLSLSKPSSLPRPLESLIGTVDFVLAYDTAASRLAPDSGLDQMAEEGNPATVLERIAGSRLAEAMLLYARGMRTRGELGVLASMNHRAWADLRERLNLDDAALAALKAVPDGADLDSSIAVFPGYVVAPDSAHLALKYKPLEEKRWEVQSLERIGSHSCALDWPETASGVFAYEIAPESRKGGWPLPGGGSRGAAAALTTLRIHPALSPAPERVPASAPPVPAVTTAVDLDHGTVTLEWPVHTGTQYTVLRDGAALATVYAGFFADQAPVSGAAVSYVVRAHAILGGAVSESRVQVRVPELPLPVPPSEVEANTRGGQAVVGWLCNDPLADFYTVTQRDSRDAVVASWSVPADNGHYIETSAPAAAGKAYTYQVTPMTPDGRAGRPSSPVGIIASGKGLAPLLALSAAQGPSAAALSRLAEQGVAVGGPGWASLPKQPAWDPDRELTIAVWVKFVDRAGKPVLICKGPWGQSAYHLQVCSGRFRFYLAGFGVLQGGEAVVGQWQQVVATYGRGEMRLFVDGKAAGRKRVAGAASADVEPDAAGHVVRGLLDAIQLYNEALTPEEIAAQVGATRPAY